ncbi:Putative Polyprotein (Fragment) [Rhizopus microsporus]
MPPSVRGRKPTVPVLSSEQVQNLYKQFEIQRRQLVCTGCQTMDSLYRNGTSPDDPLQPKKAPGPGHLRQEMLAPLQPALAPLLLFLFQLCWTWSYTPADWRLAQVVSIYKKGDPNEPGNHRPISLTSVFRKAFRT